MYKEQIKPRLGLINPGWKQNPLFRSLVTCMPLLEGGGSNTADLIGRGSPIDLERSVWVTDKHGPCVYQDNDAVINFNQPSSAYNGNSLALAFWLSTRSTATGDEYIVYLDVDASNYFRLRRSNNQMDLAMQIGGAFRPLSAPFTGNNDGDMHLWTFVSDSNGVYFYFDDKLGDSDIAGDAWAGDSNPFHIGSTFSDGWIGNVGGFLGWNRGLLAEEVKQLYELGPSMGLGDSDLITYHGSISPAGVDFNPAYAINSNQVL